MAIKTVHSSDRPKSLHFDTTVSGESKYEVHCFVGSARNFDIAN